MSVNVNKKRKSDNSNGSGGGSHTPVKKDRKDFKNKAAPGKFGNSGLAGGGKSFKKNDGKGSADRKKQTGEKSSIKKKIISKNEREGKKKQLTTIVSEAKANYQLFTDKKMDKDEKELLMKSTYELVKDNIAELARMKGMGKVITAVLDGKDAEQMEHVLSFYPTAESKLLLMKGNGYKLAIQLVKTGSQKIINQFNDACLSNPKGLRSLMTTFQSSRSLCAIYAAGGNKIKKTILRKLVLGNMPVFSEDSPLVEVFSSCKADVVEGCKTFLQSIINEKTIRRDVVQDMLAFYFQTQHSTDTEIETMVSFAADNIIQLCQRGTKCTLVLWVVWLSSAQIRKKMMKGLKGKVPTLLQTYNGRLFLLALLESVDDTKALDKLVLKELADSLDELVLQNDTRKLLEFILLPRSTKVMHPNEIEMLQQGDSVKTSKKSQETRFDEIRNYMQESVLSGLKKNCGIWLKDNKLCLFVIAVIERYGSEFEADLLAKLSSTLTSSEYTDRIADKAVRMVMESLINADAARFDLDEESPLFINFFVKDLKPQAAAFVGKCQKPVTLLQETATKTQAKLDFKLKESWLFSKATQKAITEWKKQKPAFVKK